MTDTTPTLKLSDFLSEAEIAHAHQLWLASQDNLAARIREEIILPNIQRINTALGQVNDSWYLAYAVEYVLNAAEAQHDSRV